METQRKVADGKEYKNYTKFIGMLTASFVAMYLTMYLNTYEIDHVYFSLTRFYMTCLGISTMAIIMFVAMRSMYKNKRKNIVIIVGSVALFVSALGLVRAQAPIIGDVLWLKGMIPHHSIAILTSKRAAINDAEVRKLADDITTVQKKEIEAMKAMIKRLENK